MRRDVGGADLRIALDARLAAEEVHPLADGVVRLFVCPPAQRRRQRLPARPHEHEAVHERVVDRALQPVRLAEHAVRRFAELPGGSRLDQAGGREPSRATGGSVTDAPSIVADGDVPAGNGARPGANVRCSAVTFAVVRLMAWPSRRRVDPSPLPLGPHRIDRHPEHPVVAQHPRREADLLRHGIPARGRRADRDDPAPAAGRGARRRARSPDRSRARGRALPGASPRPSRQPPVSARRSLRNTRPPGH